MLASCPNLSNSISHSYQITATSAFPKNSFSHRFTETISDEPSKNRRWINWRAESYLGSSVRLLLDLFVNHHVCAKILFYSCQTVLCVFWGIFLWIQLK